MNVINFLLIFVFILVQTNCIAREEKHCKEGVYNSLGENNYLALCLSALTQPDKDTNVYVQTNMILMCDRYLKQKKKCDNIPWNVE